MYINSIMIEAWQELLVKKPLENLTENNTDGRQSSRSRVIMETGVDIFLMEFSMNSLIRKKVEWFHQEFYATKFWDVMTY